MPYRSRAARWVALFGALLAVALCLPVLGDHRMLDDAVLERSFSGPPLPGFRGGIFGAFSFASGLPAENRQQVDLGLLLPWWSDPELKVAFLRPLSALTHAVDVRLWPTSTRLRYVHSLAWLCLTVLAAARLYLQVEPDRRVALGAVLLFAIDPGHASAVGWLSSRNTLIAAFFSFCAISAWISGWRWRSLLWLVAAVLSGEIGVSAAAFIASHVLIIDQRPTRERWLSLVPLAWVLATWRGVHAALGFGAHGSAVYLDPVRDLWVLLQVIPQRVLMNLGAKLGALPADLSLIVSTAQAAVCLGLAACVLGAFLFVIRSHLQRDAVARFWAVGSLLAALPLCAAPPNDRGLLFIALGAKALLVRVVFEGLDQLHSGGRRRSFRPILIALFTAWHVALAPFAMMFRAAQFRALGLSLAGGHQVLDTIAGLSERTVIAINPPLDVFASYLQLERAVSGAPVARHFYWLTSGASDLTVTRVASDALEVAREGGFCSTLLERLYRRDPTELAAGTHLEFAALRVQILESADSGAPAVVRFQLPFSLDDPSVVFLLWKAGRVEQMEPLELHEVLSFPAHDLAQVLSR